jgi:hypothetical protein
VSDIAGGQVTLIFEVLGERDHRGVELGEMLIPTERHGVARVPADLLPAESERVIQVRGDLLPELARLTGRQAAHDRIKLAQVPADQPVIEHGAAH